jgi:hypothetical protein
MRAAIYARVSTADGRQDTDNQLAQLREFAAAQGWGIANEYVDYDIWPNDWMNRLAEKSQEFPIRSCEKPESTVVENPIWLAVIVVYTMLPNVVCGVLIPTVLRRQSIEIVKLGKKLLARRPDQFRALRPLPSSGAGRCSRATPAQYVKRTERAIGTARATTASLAQSSRSNPTAFRR